MPTDDQAAISHATSSPRAYPELKIHLDPQLWEQLQSTHHQRVSTHANDFVQRRAKGEKHPVWDFLFTYYTFSPNKLITWTPGLHQQNSLLTPHSPTSPTYTWPAPKKRDLEQARWIATLCRNLLHKPARFGCHGLHEWAMVYQQSADDLRHSQYTLRLPPQQINQLIESQPLTCTHYDAFRFFTPPAIPLNAFDPTLQTRLQNEQAGCLHANMDLYKWTTKLWPWIGSDLVADSFDLACRGRALDMRASPYDLVHLGFEPIPIESEAGREQYRHEQQALTTQANPIREQLLHACQFMLETYQYPEQ